MTYQEYQIVHSGLLERIPSITDPVVFMQDLISEYKGQINDKNSYQLAELNKSLAVLHAKKEDWDEFSLIVRGLFDNEPIGISLAAIYEAFRFADIQQQVDPENVRGIRILLELSSEFLGRSPKWPQIGHELLELSMSYRSFALESSRSYEYFKMWEADSVNPLKNELSKLNGWITYDAESELETYEEAAERIRKLYRLCKNNSYETVIDRELELSGIISVLSAIPEFLNERLKHIKFEDPETVDFYDQTACISDALLDVVEDLIGVQNYSEALKVLLIIDELSPVKAVHESSDYGSLGRIQGRKGYFTEILIRNTSPDERSQAQELLDKWLEQFSETLEGASQCIDSFVRLEIVSSISSGYFYQCLVLQPDSQIQTRLFHELDRLFSIPVISSFASLNGLLPSVQGVQIDSISPSESLFESDDPQINEYADSNRQIFLEAQLLLSKIADLQGRSESAAEHREIFLQGTLISIRNYGVSFTEQFDDGVSSRFLDTIEQLCREKKFDLARTLAEGFYEALFYSLSFFDSRNFHNNFDTGRDKRDEDYDPETIGAQFESDSDEFKLKDRFKTICAEAGFYNLAYKVYLDLVNNVGNSEVEKFLILQSLAESLKV